MTTSGQGLLYYGYYVYFAQLKSKAIMTSIRVPTALPKVSQFNRSHTFERPLRTAFILLLCASMAACSLLGAKKPAAGSATGATAAKGSPEALYKEAKEELDSGAYSRAIELLDKVQSADALGIYGQQALLDSAYAQWRNTEGSLALVTVERFLKQFPRGEGVPYALYLKGLINFNERSGLITAISKEDLSERDPKSLADSFDAFTQLIQRFPNSSYAVEAQQRLTYIVNTLAQHEVGIARFYLQRGAPIAAINRAQGMLRQYGQTPAQEEALGIVAQAYQQLAMVDLRDSTLRVLKQNYPNSRHLAGGIYAAPAKAWYKLW